MNFETFNDCFLVSFLYPLIMHRRLITNHNDNFESNFSLIFCIHSCDGKYHINFVDKFILGNGKL